MCVEWMCCWKKRSLVEKRYVSCYMKKATFRKTSSGSAQGNWKDEDLKIERKESCIHIASTQTNIFGYFMKFYVKDFLEF